MTHACLDTFVHELHAHACRHCQKRKQNEKAVDKLKTSYATKLSISGTLESELENVEKQQTLKDEVTFFCENCLKVSVISFEYYEAKNQQIQCLFGNPYTKPEEYYLSLVHLFYYDN